MKMVRVMVLWKTSFAILCGYAIFFFVFFFLFTMSTELLLHSVMAAL